MNTIPEGLTVGRVVHYTPNGRELVAGGLRNGPIGGRVSSVLRVTSNERTHQVTLHLDVVPWVHCNEKYTTSLVVEADYDPLGADGTWRYPPRV